MGRRYIGGRTSRRKSDFLYSEEFFFCLSSWDHNRSSITWKRGARAESNCQEIPTKKHCTKGTKKQANYSPVRKIGVSGLMIISRRRRRLKKPITDKESISVECHNPEIHSSEHRGQGKSEKSMSCVVYVERSKEPMGFVS